MTANDETPIGLTNEPITPLHTEPDEIAQAVPVQAHLPPDEAAETYGTANAELLALLDVILGVAGDE